MRRSFFAGIAALYDEDELDDRVVASDNLCCNIL
jgi:hypothetical protein